MTLKLEARGSSNSLSVAPLPVPPKQVIKSEEEERADTALHGHPVSMGRLQEGESLRRGKEKTFSLRNELFEGTREIHLKAVQDKFLQNLTGGAICNDGYNMYLVNLEAIHLGLEQAQAIIKDVPGLKHFIFEDLWRSTALQKDIATWKTVTMLEHKPTKIALEYAAHLIETARTEPEEVIGAMYSLYGTLFHGGQYIKHNAYAAFKKFRDKKFEDEDEDKESVAQEIFDDSNESLGVALFSFPFEEVDDFKESTWHKHLNELPEKTGMPLSELSPKMIKGANEAIAKVPAFIAEAGC
jgi:hypothetical protein